MRLREQSERRLLLALSGKNQSHKVMRFHAA